MAQLANNLFQRPTVTPVLPAQAQPSQGPFARFAGGFNRAIGRLSGPVNPNLTPQEQEFAKRQQQMAMVAALLNAGGPRPKNTTSPLQPISAAITAGQQAGAQVADQSIQNRLANAQVARLGQDPNATVADPASVREFQFVEGLRQQDREENPNLAEDAMGPREQRFRDLQSSGQVRIINGVPHFITPSGEAVPMSTLESEADAAEVLAGAETRGRVATGNNIESLQVISDQVPEMQFALQDAKALLQKLETGEFSNTELLAGGALERFNADVAELAAYNIQQTLQNLQITNLAPVTEKELELVSNLAADLGNNVAVNKRLLERAIRMLERKLQTAQNKWDALPAADRPFFNPFQTQSSASPDDPLGLRLGQQ